LIATISPDDTIFLWDVATGKERGHLVGHTGWIDGVVFGPGGRRLVSISSRDQTIRLWDSGSCREVRRLTTGPGVSPTLALAPDGRTLAAGGKDWVRLWDLATGETVGTWNTHSKPVDHIPMAFTPDGRTLCTWNHAERAVYLWDVTQGKEVRHFSYIDDGPPRAFIEEPQVTISPDGRLAVFGNQWGTLRLFDTAAGKEVRRYLDFTGMGTYSAMSFSPDGRMLALAGWGKGTIYLWETATLTERRHLTGHQGRVVSLAFAADGRTLVSTGADTTALVWDVFGLAAREPAQDARPSSRQLERYWADLLSPSGTIAFAAMGNLVRSPGQAAAFLAGHLLPLPEIDVALQRRIRRWVAELDAEEFAVRERAMQELEKRKDAAEPALRQALAGRPTLELRNRVQVLLSRLDTAHRSPERLRDQRALEVLETIDSAEARRLLQALARGADGAWLTQEAKASLERLAKRKAAKP
jgi:Tol biopolymer transport system component